MGFSFVHAADLHLGCQFSSIDEFHPQMEQRLIDASFTAFTNLVDSCLEQNVDFLLLSGDVFETNQPSLRTLKLFFDQIKRLEKHAIEVFMITGNHDGGIEENFIFTIPANLHLFSDDRVHVVERSYHQVPVSIVGINFPNQISFNLIHDFPRLNPNQFAIGLLHCEVGGNDQRYIPVSLRELESLGYNYWALGHVHTARSWENSSLIQYPGVLQGRHNAETGLKGCYLVKVEEDFQLESIFMPLQDIIWEKNKVDLTTINPQQLMAELLQIKEESRASYPQGTLLELVLSGSTSCYQLLKKPETISDLLTVLNEAEFDRSNFVWITEILDDTLPETNWDQILQQDDFLSEVIAYINTLEANNGERMSEVSDIRSMMLQVAGSVADQEQIIHNAKLLAVQILSEGELEG